MNKTLMLFTALILASTAQLQAGEVDDAVEYRQAVMTIFAYNIGPMGAMAKGKIPFDEAAFAEHAKQLAVAAKLELLKSFPEDSATDDSDAKDEIWFQWDDFVGKHQAFAEAMDKLGAAAEAGGKDAMLAQFKESAGACKACHKAFKE